MIWKPKNPILWKDVERNPYCWQEEPRYSLWCRNDDERLYRIQSSYTRFLWRLFTTGAWHPNTLTKHNKDIWI